jgi:hypothetical protein
MIHLMINTTSQKIIIAGINVFFDKFSLPKKFNFIYDPSLILKLWKPFRFIMG